MTRQAIPLKKFNLSTFKAFDDWFLVTAGDFAAGAFNTMTISWGSAGVMWNRPFVQVVVRPTRHTYGFMEKYDTFTVSAFGPQYQDALDLLGTKSGRDSDKIKEAGLTPQASSLVAAPGFEQAELVMECRKIYYDDLKPEHFLANYIAKQYRGDFHRIYYGEIVAVSGIERYCFE